MSTSRQRKIDIKIIKLLLTPSWLSGLIAITGGLVVVAVVVVAFAISANHFSLQLLKLQDTNSSPVITLPNQANDNSVNTSLSTTWPLAVFWGIVGLVVFFFIETMVSSAQKINQFNQELNYVNAKRDLIIKMTIENLLLKTISAVVWLFYLNIFLKLIIPFAITESHLCASQIRNWHGLVHGLIAFVIMAVSLHLMAIFLRLIFKRPRLLSKAYYLD